MADEVGALAVGLVAESLEGLKAKPDAVQELLASSNASALRKGFRDAFDVASRQLLDGLEFFPKRRAVVVLAERDFKSAYDGVHVRLPLLMIGIYGHWPRVSMAMQKIIENNYHKNVNAEGLWKNGLATG